MSDVNRCDGCGRFRAWKDLSSYGADDWPNGTVMGWECRDCAPQSFDEGEAK